MRLGDNDLYFSKSVGIYYGVDVHLTKTGNCYLFVSKILDFKFSTEGEDFDKVEKSFDDLFHNLLEYTTYKKITVITHETFSITPRTTGVNVIRGFEGQDYGNNVVAIFEGWPSLL